MVSGYESKYMEGFAVVVKGEEQPNKINEKKPLKPTTTKPTTTKPTTTKPTTTQPTTTKANTTTTKANTTTTKANTSTTKANTTTTQPTIANTSNTITTKANPSTTKANRKDYEKKRKFADIEYVENTDYDDDDDNDDEYFDNDDSDEDEDTNEDTIEGFNGSQIVEGRYLKNILLALLISFIGYIIVILASKNVIPISEYAPHMKKFKNLIYIGIFFMITYICLEVF